MHSHALVAVILAALIAAPPLAPARAQSSSEEEITFVPPLVGAPGNRVGAGTRGAPTAAKGLTLLAPPGGGMTASPSPTLFWWLDAPFKGELSVSFGAADAARPLLSAKDEVDLPAGQHAFALGDYGLRLADDTIYRWSVTLTGKDGRNLTAESFMEVAKDQPAEADASRQAAAGNWYDALALVASDKIRRDALLRQVGIELRAN